MCLIYLFCYTLIHQLSISFLIYIYIIYTNLTSTGTDFYFEIKEKQLD